MVAQDILVVLVLVRTQVSQPKTTPENHFRGCLYFTTIRTLSVYLGSTYIRCGHIYTPSRHEIKRHTTLRQTRLILPLFFSAPNDFSFAWDWFSALRQTISPLTAGRTHTAVWQEPERWPSILQPTNTLEYNHLTPILKDEPIFWKNPWCISVA